MGVEPPFLYDPVKSGSSRSPRSSFDPRAASRASVVSCAPRPKQEGPLVKFNRHPDSYAIPYSNNVTPMNSSVKSWVKWLRTIQWILRCIELIASAGLLTMLILIRGMDVATGWIMRIVPGVAIAHTIYAIYHLSRNAAGRTPASSVSYMLFAAFFDVSITPFYAFSALVAKTKQANWTIVLANQDLTSIFTTVVFYTAAIAGGFFLVSLVISIYLAVIFRRITEMPPDMNPLEDNLTSRHKRNKSEMSTSTYAASEKRLSTPLENKRSSGAAYQDLSRPPSIPFFHTRTGSTDSFTNYKSSPPPSRDSHVDLPSRHYQIESKRSSVVDLKRASYYEAPLSPPSPPKRTSYNSIPSSDNASLRSSIVDMKRASFYDGPPPKSPKRASYTEVPISETASHRSSRPTPKKSETWYARDSLPKERSQSPPNTRSRTPSPKKGYKPVHQRHDSSEDLGHPSPLDSHPPGPPTPPRHNFRPKQESPLSEISTNRVSSDIADSYRGRPGSYRRDTSPVENFRHSKNYGELRPGTPPIMIGGKNRQVSSGTDFTNHGGYKVERRDVSGKIAEEGRAGSKWGTRLRKLSGKA